MFTIIFLNKYDHRLNLMKIENKNTSYYKPPPFFNRHKILTNEPTPCPSESHKVNFKMVFLPYDNYFQYFFLYTCQTNTSYYF